MNDRITIRPTTSDDLHELAAIYTSAYNGLNIGEKWTVEKAEKLLEYFRKEQADLFFTATIDNKIAGGIIALVKPRWDGNHLTDGEIFVSHDYQKQGVGRALIKRLFLEAVEKYDAVSWDTFTHRVYEHPLKWYKSLGFEEIKHWVMIGGDCKKVLENLNK